MEGYESQLKWAGGKATAVQTKETSLPDSSPTIVFAEDVVSITGRTVKEVKNGLEKC